MKCRIWNGRGPWLSGSGRGKSKDPGEQIFKTSREGAAEWFFEWGERMGLRLGFFCVFFFWMLAKLTPSLKNQCSMVFIGKVLLGFQTSPSTFLSFSFPFFFCKFWFFLYFCIFWKRAISTSTQWGKSLILKMTREKSNAFENLLKN